MPDRSIRPLALLVVAQVLLVGALLTWAALGFPMPAALTGADARTPPGTSASPRSSEPMSAAANRSRAPRPTANRFNSRRAFALLREQVKRYGWRPAGSATLRRLALRLRSLLPRGRLERVPGHRGLRNVVGSIPGRGKAIVVGAHYDVEAQPEGFVGANDGAAGTAAVVWLARALKRAPRRQRDRPVRFVLFDGEEEPAGCDDARFEQCALRGSKAYARRHGDDVHRLVLLDYIAEKRGLSFEREGNSDKRMWRMLRAAARDVGVGRLFPARDAKVALIDDHTPFLDRGIPAIDVIDFDYPAADTLQDTLDKVSRRSLDAVGEAVFLLVSRLRRRG
ncbi:MAG: M28 family metallopeptidase [Solirubrobacteraceae bacterium]